MRRSSLRLRLGIAAVVSIIAALTLSGFFLKLMFERHVARRMDQELSAYAKQLAAALTFSHNGKLHLSTKHADPRFQRPFSGLYWQISEKGEPVLRSTFVVGSAANCIANPAKAGFAAKP